MKANVENIEPRRALLEVWSAVGNFAMADRTWRWQGRQEPNSISDAEQLLCVLQPATALPALRLADPDETSEDAKTALHHLGSELQIPRSITEILEDYLDRYTYPDGRPSFAGGSAFMAWNPDEKLTAEQRDLDLMTSYTTSVTLCLSALEFLQDYERTTAHGGWIKRVSDLRRRFSDRLTAALIGLTRGFTTNIIEPDSAAGRTLVRTLDQDETDDVQTILGDFNQRMSEIRGRLSEATLGVSIAVEINDSKNFFELGWTWGIAEDARRVDLDDPSIDVSAQRKGVAVSAPYLYFTLMAMDAIERLTHDRVRRLALLNPLQDRLANALALRRDLAQLYWSELARFGGGRRWPLEDLPWRTVDDTENDYYSLAVSALLIQDLSEHGATEQDLQRLDPLLAELASRARITRRALHEDPALRLHDPGFDIELEGAEALGPKMAYRLSDFAPVLFKRTTQLAQLTIDPKTRDRLLNLAARLWNHLSMRRIEGGKAAGLWDDPARAYGEISSHYDEPLWSTNARVVDALISSATALNTRQMHNATLNDTAAAMVSEAEFLLNQQQMTTPALRYSPMQRSLDEIRASLQRARLLIERQPSKAIALCVNAVMQLDKNEQARLDARRRDGRE
ncbi:MAG TPA: SCO2524 family protein [Actinocrinis sp.]|nr:SCO2524 family protein [Actinocrinis sp.]